MRNLALALALAVLPLPAIAKSPDVFVAILSETADGFDNLTECEAVLRGARKGALVGSPRQLAPGAQAGSLFNRTHGNLSRCEMVQGEPSIVVYPKGYSVESNRR